MSSGFVEPVLVFTMARSKSSLVTATVIDTLGAWVGTCTSPEKGYPRGQLENRRIVDLQRAWFGRGWVEAEKGNHCQPKDGFREAVIKSIEKDGYPGGPWVYKCSAWYAPAFLDAFPEARVITVRRDTEGIWASAHRYGGRIASSKVISAHNRMLDALRDVGALEVRPSDRLEDIDRLKSWLVQ